MDQTFCNNFKVNQTRVQVFVNSFEQLVKCFEQIKFIICVLNYFPSILCNNAELTQLLALAMNLSDISLLPGSHLQLLHPERCVRALEGLAGPREARWGESQLFHSKWPQTESIPSPRWARWSRTWSWRRGRSRCSSASSSSSTRRSGSARRSTGATSRSISSSFSS